MGGPVIYKGRCECDNVYRISYQLSVSVSLELSFFPVPPIFGIRTKHLLPGLGPPLPSSFNSCATSRWGQQQRQESTEGEGGVGKSAAASHNCSTESLEPRRQSAHFLSNMLVLMPTHVSGHTGMCWLRVWALESHYLIQPCSITCQQDNLSRTARFSKIKQMQTGHLI